MDFKTNVSIHNRFDFVVKDANTMETIQTAQAENVVCNGIYNRLCTFNTYFDYIVFGSGTGTPTATDTALFTRINSKSATTTQLIRTSPTSTWTKTIRLDVDEYNGNTLREVGISHDGTTVNTHALITDSEGNTLQLTKDNTKIIDIYATVYITLYDVDGGLYFSGTGLRDYLTGSSMATDTITIGYVSDDNSATGSSTRTYSTSEKSVTTTYKFGVNDFNNEVRYIQWNSMGIKCILPRTGVFEGFAKTGVSLGTGDGTKTTFTIPNSSIKNLVVYLNGTSTTDYTINNVGNIVFNTAPVSGVAITADYTCNYIPKDVNHTLTITMKIVFGGGQPTAVMPAKDYSTAPGSKTTISGNTTYGFFGEVTTTDLISGDNLCTAIGLTAGTSQYSTEPWLKFALDGRILYVAKKPIRYNLSWDNINTVGAVFGNKNIILNGIKYAVRLLSSSEWDKLMYPIHTNYKTWASYTDADLLTSYSYGNGSYSWTSTPSGSGRVFRGYNGVSSSNTDTPSNVNTVYGFRPVLEIL